MNALKIYRDAEWALEHNKITLGEFDERIKPLADVEAVVRCKDCIYGDVPKLVYRKDDIYCARYEIFHNRDFYCANGMMKDGDDE